MFYSLLCLESCPSHPHRSPCSLSPLSLPRGGWEGSNQHRSTEHTFPTRGGSLSPHGSPPTPPLLKTPASHRGQHPEDLPREAPGVTPNEPKGNLPRPDEGMAVLITRRSGSVFLFPQRRETETTNWEHTRDEDSDEEKNRMLLSLQRGCYQRRREGERREEDRVCRNPSSAAHSPRAALQRRQPTTPSTRQAPAFPDQCTRLPSGEGRRREPRRRNGHPQAPGAAWERTRSMQLQSTVWVWVEPRSLSGGSVGGRRA